MVPFVPQNSSRNGVRTYVLVLAVIAAALLGSLIGYLARGYAVRAGLRLSAVAVPSVQTDLHLALVRFPLALVGKTGLISDDTDNRQETTGLIPQTPLVRGLRGTQSASGSGEQASLQNSSGEARHLDDVLFSGVAQLAARRAHNPEVVGSTPTAAIVSGFIGDISRASVKSETPSHEPRDVEALSSISSERWHARALATLASGAFDSQLSKPQAGNSSDGQAGSIARHFQSLGYCEKHPDEKICQPIEKPPQKPKLATAGFSFPLSDWHRLKRWDLILAIALCGLLAWRNYSARSRFLRLQRELNAWLEAGSWSSFNEAGREITKLAVRDSQVRRIIQTWLDKQGHDRCWYYPDLFRELAAALDLKSTVPPKLPTLEEFREGCRWYQSEEYGLCDGEHIGPECAHSECWLKSVETADPIVVTIRTNERIERRYVSGKVEVSTDGCVTFCGSARPGSTS